MRLKQINLTVLQNGFNSVLHSTVWCPVMWPPPVSTARSLRKCHTTQTSDHNTTNQPIRFTHNTNECHGDRLMHKIFKHWNEAAVMWHSVPLFSNTSILPCQSSFHEFFTLTCMLYRFATDLVILHASTATMFCSRFTPDVVLEGSAVDLMADRLERLYSNALRWLNTNIKIQIKMVIGSRSCSWKVNWI